MPSVLPFALQKWLASPSHREVDAGSVPGLDRAERKALGGVGGIAKSLLTSAQVVALPTQVRGWMEASLAPPADGVDQFRAALKADPDVALASLYSSVVRREHRRQLGTFFTPSAEVKLMLDLWAETQGSTPHTVIDVGAGVGVFTAEAALKWPNARVVAVDINPVTLGLLAVRLFSEIVTPHSVDFSQRVELVCDDYTKWFVSAEAPEPGGRLILGNPPYTRAQLISASERVRLHQLTAGLCGSRASLSTVIAALTIQGLGPTDGLSLLLPAQWLESQYARELRKVIWETRRRRVELRLVESEDLFGGAQVDAVALLVGAEDKSPQPFHIAKWRSSDPIELDRTQEVPASWRSPFENDPSPVVGVPGLLPVRLSEIAEVHRGIATGSNSTFVLTTAGARGLPPRALTRVITRLADLTEDLDAEAIKSVRDSSVGWLLTITEDLVAKHAKLARLVSAAEELKVHERVLCSRRAVWYDLTSEISRPDVVIGAMTQGRFKLVTNSVEATITNNLYGITWKGNVDVGQRREVLQWLRSAAGQVALAAVARRQGAGLMKLEPGGLKTVLIPAMVVGKLHDKAEGAPASKALRGRLT